MAICKICQKSKNNLEKHVQKEHNITIDEYLKLYPQVQCQICKKYYNSLNAHIGAIHNLTIEQYRKRFPGAPIQTEESKKLNLKTRRAAQKKIEETNLKRYGCKTPFQNKEVKEKIKQTFLKKYGVENISQSQYAKDKKIETSLKHYGVKYPILHPSIQEKIRKTNQKRFGVDFWMKSKENAKIVGKLRMESNLKNWIPKICARYDVTLLDEYVGGRIMYNFQCNKCKSIFKAEFNSGLILNGRCSKCKPETVEDRLYKYICEILGENVKVIRNTKKIIKPYELDIYIPEKKIAIEFDGLYWHSQELGMPNNYHLMKTEMCEEKGIQLIHIFEDEWEHKQDIVKSRLKHILGITDRTIYARNCVISEIEPSIKNEFLNKYHIQGEDKSTVKLGAFYNDELVAVMTFSKPRIALGYRKNNKIEYELTRFATSCNVIGIASKLFKYFIRNYRYDKIFSFADRRWSQGNLYYKLGFKLENVTKPNYWYYDGIYRYHRYKFTKHQLVKEGYSKDMTESQIMKEKGFNRIYDCGNYKFVF